MGVEARGFRPQRGEQGQDIPRGVLDQTLSMKVYGLTQRYPGETKLIDLRIAPPTLKRSDYEIYGYSSQANPPAGWSMFYFELPERVRKQVSTAFKDTIREGFISIQQIRDATEEQLRFRRDEDRRKRKTRITQAMALFLKEAFGPEIPPETGENMSG